MSSATHKKRVKKERKVLEDEFHCKTIDLPQNIRDQFVVMKQKLKIDIIKRNHTTPQYHNPNIRRLELVTTGKLFRDLSISNNEQDKLFTTILNEALELDNYTIRGYLTWPIYHFLNRPSVTKLYDKANSIMDDEVDPRKICLFSLEQFQDYYLQLWHLSGKGDLQAPRLCRIITNKICIFNGDVIHSGGFRSEVSTGNFRVQLMFTRKCHYDNLYPWEDSFNGDF